MVILDPSLRVIDVLGDFDAPGTGPGAFEVVFARPHAVRFVQDGQPVGVVVLQLVIGVGTLALKKRVVGEEIGVPGFGLAYSGIRTSLDVALLPWFTPARLPGVGTRWAVAPQPSDLAGLIPPGSPN